MLLVLVQILNSSTICRPARRFGTSRVVSGGKECAAIGILSNPTTEISSGTWARSTARVEHVDGDLIVERVDFAVGRSAFGRAMMRLTPCDTPSTVFGMEIRYVSG